MPRGDESTDSDSDRDSYSSDSAETEEDYEKKDEDVDSELSFTKGRCRGPQKKGQTRSFLEGISPGVGSGETGTLY